MNGSDGQVTNKTEAYMLSTLTKREFKEVTMFKNIRIFKISDKSTAPDTALLTTALAKTAFEPCQPTQEVSVGWVSPRPVEHSPLLEVVNGQWLLKLQIERKTVPSSAVKALLKQRCKEIEEARGRGPSRKEKKDLQEDIKLELLPRAFSKTSSVLVWLDMEHRTVIVGSTSGKQLDEVITQMVKAFSEAEASLEIREVTTELSPSTAMTIWLQQKDGPYQFSLDRELELRQPDSEQASVKYSRHNLEGDDILQHITEGKVPVQLAMTWQNRVSFVLCADQSIKKIELLDDVFVDSDNGEDFDGDVALTTGELAKMIPALIEALGGEQTEENQAN